jgi:hypothetical protein
MAWALLIEGAQPMVDLSRRMFDEAQRANDRRGHALLADAEIAAGTFGLRSPKSIGRHLDGAERVTFGARLGHAGRQMTENGVQSKESPLPLALQTLLYGELPSHRTDETRS